MDVASEVTLNAECKTTPEDLRVRFSLRNNLGEDIYVLTALPKLNPETRQAIADAGAYSLFLSKPAEAREDNPIDFLVHVRKVGKPLYPQFGLEPNVYYIPPIHVDSEAFLSMLFGPGSRAAIEAYRKAMNGEDPELLAALLLAVSTDRIITRFQLVGDRVHAWAENGDQVVDMPLKVPTVERAPFDPALNVYRYNFT